MRAILLAKATIATFSGRRRHSSVIHGSISLACVSTERAPWINSVRR